jgi:hypothetical protein
MPRLVIWCLIQFHQRVPARNLPLSTDHRHASSDVARLLRTQTQEDLTRRLVPKLADPAPRIPRSSGSAG